MLRRVISGFTAAVIGSLAVTTLAETTAEDAYDYRESVMSSLGGHIGAASKIVRGLVEDDGYLLDHAQALAAGVAEARRLFPAGSAVGDSEALPAIWENPDDFAAALDQAEEAAEQFRVAVATDAGAEAVGEAFRNLGGACKGCHDDFRKDD